MCLPRVYIDLCVCTHICTDAHLYEYVPAAVKGLVLMTWLCHTLKRVTAAARLEIKVWVVVEDVYAHRSL